MKAPIEFPPKPDRPEDAEVEPYGFTPDFERAIAATAATSARFWGRFEGKLMPDGFKDAAVVLALKAVAAIARDGGSGPSSVATVIQRIRTWQDDGQATKQEVASVRNMLVTALDGELPPEAEVATEVSPVIRRRLQQAALDQGYKGLVSRGDLADVETQLAQARRIGKATRRMGLRIDASGFEAIRRRALLGRLPSGIAELDDEVRGGVREGEYWLDAGGYGSGKSMKLNQQFAHALSLRLNAALATLELSTDLQYHRAVANLTEIPINDLEDDMKEEGERRMELLLERGLIGYGVVEHFAANSTTPQDIVAWLLEEEERSGVRFDLLVVDYADKLAWGEKGVKKDEADMHIAEYLRSLMDRDEHPELALRWVQSASQIKGSAHDRKKTKVIEGHHAADSIHKPRVCDGMWTINPRDDGESNVFNLTKNRTGKANAKVGPLPTEYHLGRIAPTERPDWPFRRG